MKYILYTSATLALALASCKPSATVKDNPVVTTPSSVSDVSIDVKFMDQTVSPKTDFFMFANGTWCKENPVPESESRWGSFNELDQRNKVVLTRILEIGANSNSEKGTQNQLLGDFYTSYITMRDRDEAGMGPLKARLEMLYNVKSREEIASIVAKQHKVGINSLFGFGVGQDLKNNDKNTVYIGQGGLGLPNKDYYFQENKQNIRDKYVTYIRLVLEKTGFYPQDAEDRAKRIFQFERRLADAMMSPAESRLPEKTYNKMAMKDFNRLCPSFDFEKYLKTVGCEHFDTIVVGQPEFLQVVNNLIGELPMQDWIDYLSWKSINHYSNALTTEMRQLNFDFYQGVLSGKSVMKPIKEQCIDEITGNALGELLGKAFVEVSYSQNAQARVNGMVDNLLAAFQDRIKGLDWMSSETKTEALKKLNAIGRKLGFPEEWKDLSSIDITSNDYIQNLDNIAMYQSKDELSKLYKPIDKKEWGMPAHMVNAYYNPLLNEIAFPAGIMQPPFFNEKAEDALNYGRIGMVIGHEFTHGFDDNGSKFAADGSYSNWWQESDRKLFEERTGKLGATFEHFCPIEGNCVNPDLTMGENIADLGGLTMAYYAYTKTKEFKSGVKINGYTPAQRFFISYAQLWKINYTEAELKKRIATDPHSPGMYRVNGPLMNCPEFFAAFDIKEGDAMRNSSAKVAKIW